MFDRATIRLGIGPHSSFYQYYYYRANSDTQAHAQHNSQFKRDDTHRPYVTFLAVELVLRDLRSCKQQRNRT